MAGPQLHTIEEALFWAYANVARADMALEAGCDAYHTQHHVVRAALFRDLCSGAKKMGPLTDELAIEATYGRRCAYCAAPGDLARPPLMPALALTKLVPFNAVWSCPKCCAAQADAEVLRWLARAGRFPPIYLLRRVLKLQHAFLAHAGLLHTPLEAAASLALPFDLAALPLHFPPPAELTLWATVRTLQTPPKPRAKASAPQRAQAPQQVDWERLDLPLEGMDFIALDVETANSHPGSVCQIGLAKVRAGKVDGTWMTYVDPEQAFEAGNIWIHHITAQTVAGAPNFAQIYRGLAEAMRGEVVIAHTGFDRRALACAAERYGLPEIACTWLDSLAIARRAWDKEQCGSYGLGKLCGFLGYRFKHHDALEDALAAAHIVLAACHGKGLNIPQWQVRVQQPVKLPKAKRPAPPSPAASRAAPPSASTAPGAEAQNAAEGVVLAGSLVRRRKEVIAAAEALGYRVDGKVSAATRVVIIGEGLLAKEESGAVPVKVRQAEARIAKGQAIRFMGEEAILALAAQGRRGGE